MAVDVGICKGRMIVFMRAYVMSLVSDGHEIGLALRPGRINAGREPEGLLGERKDQHTSPH